MQPLLGGTPTERLGAIAALMQRGAPPTDAELDALFACLADGRKDIQRRAAEAIAATAAVRSDVQARLHSLLGASEVRYRWGAVYAFSLLGSVPPSALPTLLELFGSHDGDLRWAAADLLKRLAQRDRGVVVDALLGLASAPGPQRKMALYALRDLDVAGSYDVAIAALSDAEIGNRLAALAVIAKVHPSPAVAARCMAALLDDGDLRMQRAAAGTLSMLGAGDDDVVEALRRAGASPDASLRRAAARSLRALEDRAARTRR